MWVIAADCFVQQTLYFANVSLGTPPQPLRLHIDTGSSDLWTNAPSSRLCQSRGNPCSISGTYDANSSSTYNFVSSDFNISYVDGSYALGDYATETIRIGGQEIRDLQFGVGYRSTSSRMCGPDCWCQECGLLIWSRGYSGHRIYSQ